VTQPLSPVHDFVAKLRQPSLHGQVAVYLAWQRVGRRASAVGRAAPPPPAWAPLSVNLDLTTACNYACDHCIDFETLNSGIAHRDEELRASLTEMAARGLRSVILIGGGEPTVHPGFAGIVRHVKSLGLQAAVVSNGSRNEKIAEVADAFTEGDWIRLSLDAGTDATFQAMHRPKRPITLEAICAGIAPIRKRNPAPRIGFSFILVWAGAERAPGAPLVDNVDEMERAARLARDAGFDYVSFKPYLARAPEGAEVMDPAGAREAHARLLARIDRGLAAARTLESPGFRVLESTNLALLRSGRWRDWTKQPRTCHMQALRQVLSPLGVYNCPAHRGVPKARLADRDGYAGAARAHATNAALAGLLGRFDASHECREVTCLYNATNWWLERAVDDPAALGEAAPLTEEDAFL
jgi:MoaA/NifB/PqqE/SkfB family radical SAM enzyme